MQMKNFIATMMAGTMLASVAFQTQAAPAPKYGNSYSHSSQMNSYERNRNYRGKKDFRKRKWQRGQRYSNWRGHREVTDWRRHHLARPGPGQRWIKVGDEYLLVSVLTGIIFGAIIAGN